MRTFARCALLLAFAWALAWPLAGAEPPLTNADIVEMTHAGLAAGTIVARIRQSDGAFRTDPQTLIELVGEHVDDAVIRAMIEQQSARSHVAGPYVPAPASARAAKPQRIDHVAVATTSSSRCRDASLELSSTGLKTSGCRERDVNVEWKDVQSVCYAGSSRGTVLIATSKGTHRISTTGAAKLKLVRDTIRAFAPGTREESSCH
jgi:hypothetical protein